jgi:hypothetical protein
MIVRLNSIHLLPLVLIKIFADIKLKYKMQDQTSNYAKKIRNFISPVLGYQESSHYFYVGNGAALVRCCYRAA